jgi:hypothetical protein
LILQPFERNPLGYIYAVSSGEADWLFSVPSIARREYTGVEMFHSTKNGWCFKTAQGWEKVYPKVNLVDRFKGLINADWVDTESLFEYVEEFEEADSPFTDEYEPGYYWLVPPGEHSNDPWYLVSMDYAEQLSDINMLDIHTLSVPEAYNALQHTLSPMRDEILGVIFTTEQGDRARIRITDFDWNDYDSRTL